MKYGSVCSGIEAATVAWAPLGWKAVWFAEIEKFPSAVLAARWPEVANLGDMTKIAAAVRAGLRRLAFTDAAGVLLVAGAQRPGGRATGRCRPAGSSHAGAGDPVGNP